MSAVDVIDLTCEPMDVDRSLNSSGKSVSPPVIMNRPHRRKQRLKNQHTCELTSVGPNLPKVKRLEVNLSILGKRKQGKLKKMCALFLMVLFATISSYYWLRTNCCSKSLLPKVHGMLLHKLYGQKLAIGNIVDSFADKNMTKITLLYGSTGVGKTYASQIILEHLQNNSNVFQFIVPIFPGGLSTSAFLTELTLCDFVFIVVDDVSLSDTNVIPTVRDILDKSRALHKDIHLMLIFNTDIVSDEFQKSEHDHFRRVLELTFHDVVAKKYFVHFTKLTDAHLRMCIEDALSFYNYKWNEKLISNLLKSFNVQFDGCKRVHSKLKGMSLQSF